ncbi:hypothetical protein NIES208_13445 [[Limnothrix rosea] IAM M-220]|nr:hypothetical protein NIES208_13445 [[Limnothrix rosea] IAM M-220]
MEILGFSPNYIGRVVAPNLWKTLGDCCGQRVGIRRLQLVLKERYAQLTPSERSEVAAVEILVSLDDDDSEKQKIGDTPEAPRLYASSLPLPAVTNPIYNHDSTLATLKHLLKENYHSLTFVYGAGGVGKTSLVSHLLTELVSLPVVWCNLGEQQSFADSIEFIRSFWPFPITVDGAIASLCQYLQEHPVVLVFDQWELLFAEGELSGTYQSQYAKYQELLGQLARYPLAGQVLVLTHEIAPSMECLSAEEDLVASVRVPELNHEAAKKILREYGLQDPALWLDFVRTYKGNPLKLRLLCNDIREWHGGSIQAFNQQNTIIGGDTLRDILRQLTDPVTDLERQILNWLMLWGKPITLPQLQDSFVNEVTFSTEVWDVTRSLERRFLLDKSASAELPVLMLQPSIHRYLMQEFVQGCCGELGAAIAAGYDPTQLKLLGDYRLVMHQAMVLNRESIAPVVLAILKGLRKESGSCDRLRAHLEQLKLATQKNPELCQFHGASNVMALYEAAECLIEQQ